MVPGMAQSWPAPGKLNLMLRVVGRRADGYHLLQTVFQFIDFGDQLRFRARADGRVTRAAPLAGVPESDDLVVRAAKLLQRASGCDLGVEIELVKRLPMGGGLGGGSSDAATVLVALDRLWHLGWGEERLAELGLSLGADVPVFVRGRAAWAEGIGDRLVPLDLPEPWYVVLIPSCRVSTREIFAVPELTRDMPRITIADFLAGNNENTCLPVVRARYPAVASAMDWLSRYAQARLTGTGACVFGVFELQSRALEVLDGAPTGWKGFVTQGKNRSPLYTATGV